jgi:hypothetical protein
MAQKRPFVKPKIEAEEVFERTALKCPFPYRSATSCVIKNYAHRPSNRDSVWNCDPEWPNMSTICYSIYNYGDCVTNIRS